MTQDSHLDGDIKGWALLQLPHHCPPVGKGGVNLCLQAAGDVCGGKPV